MTGFVAELQLAPEFTEGTPLREQWLAACMADRQAAIEQRLRELPEGWRLAVSEGSLEQGDQPGAWRLTHQFIAIDPAMPGPLPIPARPGRWDIYGPIRREQHDL